MPEVYGRDLDLNLLRVFAVVAEAGSVTAAASRLYLTQPAVSAALRRLQTTVGVPLFARQGRGLVLTARGEQLRAAIRPHLQPLVDAALIPEQFALATSDRTFRLGLSDASEIWLLPPLLRVLAREAPRMRVIVVPVQFRTIAAAFAQGLDAAVTVADELPSSIRRAPLLASGFVCVHDPRHTRFKRLTERSYFEHEHVIVSYNADLRGVVEDAERKQRRVRVSVPTFAAIGTLIEDTALLATVPRIVGAQIVKRHPHLRLAPLPFQPYAGTIELLWPAATDDDEPCRWLRARLTEIARSA
jgi:LysR family transcriptional activator of mexEF-oprN operon